MQQDVYRKKDFNTLKSRLQHIAKKKILLIRGKTSFHNSGAVEFIFNLTGSRELVYFNDYSPNPKIEDLRRGLELVKKNKYDLIIAIGGGSTLDMGKLISGLAFYENFDSVLDGNLQLDSKIPLLAIPTTAGSGAEATHFAVLYKSKKKYSIAHKTLLPDMIFLSGEFTAHASKYLKAYTGLDAFSQAVESVWSVNANNTSIEIALKAAKLCWNNLYQSIEHNNSDSVENMQEAAYLAGKAIDITKTTAPHAISYAFTSFYNIPHGHAVALSLPFFLEYNYAVSDTNCIDVKGAHAVKKRIELLLQALNLNPENMKNSIFEFFGSVGINICIAELISNFNPDIILNNINLERLKNNPRLVTKEEVKRFLVG